MSEELKPCAFCRKPPVVEDTPDGQYITCKTPFCPAEDCYWGGTVAGWNARAQDSELAALRTKLEKAERKLAQARAEGMETAAKVCEEDESGRDGGGYFADAIRSAIEKERG